MWYVRKHCRLHQRQIMRVRWAGSKPYSRSDAELYWSSSDIYPASTTTMFHCQQAYRFIRIILSSDAYLFFLSSDGKSRQPYKCPGKRSTSLTKLRILTPTFRPNMVCRNFFFSVLSLDQPRTSGTGSRIFNTLNTVTLRLICFYTGWSTV